MGAAYFLQFLDKLALSQATLFNLREDLVFILIQLLAKENMLTKTIEHERGRIFMGICDLLFWVFCLELVYIQTSLSLSSRILIRQ
jgi:hypothetical protein